MMAGQARSLDIEVCIRLARGRMNDLVNLMRGGLFIVFNHRRPITLLSWGNHMYWNGHTTMNRHAE
jgi:hypothetical protein